MSDEPVRPVAPIRPVQAVRDVEIPQRPSYGKLMTWLRFSQRVARRAKVAPEAEAPPPEEHHGPGKWV